MMRFLVVAARLHAEDERCIAAVGPEAQSAADMDRRFQLK